MPANAVSTSAYSYDGAMTGGAPASARVAATENSGQPITVEAATPARLAAIEADWRDLVARADVANVFMHPALVRLAGESTAHHPLVLLAWQTAGTKRRLAGVWAFSVGRAPRSVLPVTVLSSPPMPNAYLSTPVIDRDCLDAVIEAMLATIAATPGLPKTVALEAMSDGSATMQALARVLAARGAAPYVFSRSQRPKLASTLDGKTYLEKALSASSRKKLRQHRRRLAEKGVLQSTVVTDADDVSRAMEDFLALEASGWKGRERTALSSNPTDAKFARGMIATLAATGDASIHMLTLDGRPISMQIVLRSGPGAFTWKTAYDEAFRDFSPGMLLLEDYTAALLAEDSIAAVDSCAFDDSGYMAAWRERVPLAQLWFDARTGGSAAFAALARVQHAYLALRTRAKTLYRTLERKAG